MRLKESVMDGRVLSRLRKKRPMTNNRRWWSIERKWQQSDKQSSYWAGFFTPVKTGQEAMCHFKWRKRIKCDQLTKTGYFKARPHLSRQESSKDGEVMSQASCCLCAHQMSTHLITTYTGPAGHHTTAGSNNLFITYRFHTTMGRGGQRGTSESMPPSWVCTTTVTRWELCLYLDLAERRGVNRRIKHITFPCRRISLWEREYWCVSLSDLEVFGPIRTIGGSWATRSTVEITSRRGNYRAERGQIKNDKQRGVRDGRCVVLCSRWGYGVSEICPLKEEDTNIVAWKTRQAGERERWRR